MTSNDPVFHFPPDVFDAVVDAVPVMTRGKRDVLLFFQGCGVDRKYLGSLEPWTAQESSGLCGTYSCPSLTHLNEIGDSGLRQRREVLKRVSEFDNFSSCADFAGRWRMSERRSSKPRAWIQHPAHAMALGALSYSNAGGKRWHLADLSGTQRIRIAISERAASIC